MFHMIFQGPYCSSYCTRDFMVLGNNYLLAKVIFKGCHDSFVKCDCTLEEYLIAYFFCTNNPVYIIDSY